MKTSRDDEWRRRYLRILTSKAKEVGESQEDLQAIEDLVDEKLIRAWTVPDAQGVVRGASLVDDANGFVVPTLKGRLFVEEQRAILRSRTFLGRIKANWPLFSGIIGIIVGWSLGLVSPLIQQRLHPTPSGHTTSQQPDLTPTASPTPSASATSP